MFVATSDSKNSCKASQDSNTPKCIIENSHNADTNCMNPKVGFPVINEVQKHPVPKDTRDETSRLNLSLPKLNQDKISKQRIDAGEPCASDFGFVSGNSDSSFVPCTNNRQFQLLNVSSSESLENSITLSLSTSSTGQSFRRMKLLEKQKGEAKDDKVEESQALKRWEFWMNEKKKMQNSLSKRLNRPPFDLLIQESDKYREVVEKKLMLWYSRTPEPDEQMGNPARSKPQLRLRDKKTQAQYCLIKSKLEPGERPELEMIGLSLPIKQEKGLLPGEKFENNKEKKEARHAKKVHCKEEHRCGSHELNMDELVVVGFEVFNNWVKRKFSYTSENLPKIILSSEAERPLKCCERKSIFCLAINGEEIKYEIGSDYCQDRDRMFVWNVDFGITQASTFAEKVLRVENRGTVAVRYDWLCPKNKQKFSLNALQPRHYDPWFFFNKNSGYFLPGQIYNLKFYFHAQTSGVRKEAWHLKTNPPLSKNIEFATIILSGVATEEFYTEPKFLEIYLERRNQESSILDFMNKVLYKVFNPAEELCGIEYRSIFSEKQLFEYQNPKHHYHSKIVEELRGIFQEIPCKVQTEWDLSIASLRDLIGAYKTGDDQTNCIAEVVKKSSALFRPNYLPEKNKTVYRMSYGILCKVINSMEQDFMYLKNLVTEKIAEPSILGESEEASISGVNIFSTEEETGEIDIRLPDIKPINFMFFRSLFYLKVYHRVCEAAEHIAGVIETRKFFKPWKKVSYKPSKPTGRGKVCPAK